MSTVLVMRIAVSGAPLSEDDVVAVARGGVGVMVDGRAWERMSRSREVVDLLAATDEPAYGISTGFGALASRSIAPALRGELQKALVRSHAAGMGPAVERETVRAMMLLRLRTLATGYSGVRPQTAAALAALIDRGITPVVPEHGSLGCSGDLAPLAHVALTLIGEGEAAGPDGAVRPAGELLAAYGLTPLEPGPKEGLALLNGTDGMLGMLILACADLDRLLVTADLAAAMSVEALLGTDRAFAADLIALRPHPGQARSAANLTALLRGSAIVASHRTDDPRVQDAYSLRCAPQVAGAARDSLAHARAVAGRESASAIDNPVVLEDGRIESSGNFHGAPLALALDLLAIAVAQVGAIAERRTDRLLDPARSHGLPAFLAGDPGLDSGLMLAHYTQAAMVAESRRLAAPASVDSLPTSAMQEDHVSMGWGAGRKLRRALANLERILAVEIVAAARGLDLRAPLAPAPATAAARDALRERVPGPGPDRFLAPELARAGELVASGALVRAAEALAGRLL